MGTPRDSANLREKALDSLRNAPDLLPSGLEGLFTDQVAGLFHDLRVHQAELEIQNEELRTTQNALERVKAEYLDLYDHAPVGYATVSPDGCIVKANATLALLLRQDPTTLVGQPLAKFEADGLDKLYFLLKNLQRGHGAPPWW